ncbi:HSP20-like chaperone [Globomyces pollinis-pini]|nr:HSP20-like chaperone [Globomyces pollinis-pini]
MFFFRDNDDYRVQPITNLDIFRPLRSIDPFSILDGSFGIHQFPALDLIDTNEAFIVEANIPGYKKHQIAVSVKGDTLEIKGQPQPSDANPPKQYIYRERFFGNFTRGLVLPESVNADQVVASLEDGVLNITIPKVKAKEGRKIIIN